MVKLESQYLDGGMERFATAAGMQLTAEIVEGEKDSYAVLDVASAENRE